MAINLVVAVTDSDWFNLLRQQTLLKEVNFWAPSDKNFRALQPGELFLFKLHAPVNKIVGGGIFAYATSLPLSLAWETFGIANGATTLTEMRRRIAKYRRAGAEDRSDFPIGCRILTQPFFFDEHDWLPVPASWSGNIVSLKTFEAVCEKLFAQGGFETLTQSHGADGGVDIWLHSRHSDGPAAIVQCKHWQGKQVGVKELREFYGVMSSHKLKRGTYAASSTFTPAAMTFAKENGISALDRNGLLALISRRTPAQQQELLQTAYEGEYWRPTCASCGTKMVERAKKNGGAGFWGCASYPHCKSTLPMRAPT